jgi:hypothetical protein
MNGIERRYLAEILRPRETTRDLIWFAFESLKLQIGHRCWYTPDFVVVAADGTIECHEVKATWGTGKAGWEEDARVKIKAAASRYPFLRFTAANGGNRGWNFEEIKSDGAQPVEVDGEGSPKKIG